MAFALWVMIIELEWWWCFTCTRWVMICCLRAVVVAVITVASLLIWTACTKSFICTLTDRGEEMEVTLEDIHYCVCVDGWVDALIECFFLKEKIQLSTDIYYTCLPFTVCMCVHEHALLPKKSDISLSFFKFVFLFWLTEIKRWTEQ